MSQPPNPFPAPSVATGIRLRGKTALITGAGLGIGRATTIRMAEEGAAVILADRDEDRLSESAALLDAMGARHLAVPCDVTEQASVAALFAAAQDFAPLDILVNNVGGGRSGRIWDMSVEDWDLTMAVSLRSMFLCTRAALPGMMARGTGRIVCLSSGARHGTVWNAFYTGAAAYATAKAGVIGFVRDLAIELGDHGITINAVAPGPIDTELAGPYLSAMHDKGLEYSPVRMVPMHRLGTSREVADAILFLSSDEASYITGATIDVAGGR
ncbi:SDR family oxidoreductase [Novosphingobium sp. FSY-8]|uniref:SDR family oxidoreductase n=1 Tax=Novosphingobium ovatum TaxID=1908523 RepID=A0ABW9XBS3_9SPHN|nr:SDR family NAD(P)-dependent oxidoreductase [Novosphingobium ovatum]NBC35981.1 SDR family oxidoreductase [Novosphingobium ovatum]